jgi:hypothetical protein
MTDSEADIEAGNPAASISLPHLLRNAVRPAGRISLRRTPLLTTLNRFKGYR